MTPAMKKKMQKLGYTKWDAADVLRGPEDYAAYLEASIAGSPGDQAVLMKALETVARAKKMNLSQLAREVGITRGGLYEALSGKRASSFATVRALLEAMGMSLTISAK